MARRCQRVLPRRRMHQRLVVGAQLREQAHVTSDTPRYAGRAPLVGRLSQRALKRTLRGNWREATPGAVRTIPEPLASGFAAHGERSLAEARRRRGALVAL